MHKLRLLLLPFAWTYALVVEGIKWSYRLGWKKAQRSEVATIVVGNLSVGGTGKTPHVEYILRHLGAFHQFAVLSRGYGRSSKGILRVNIQNNAQEAGDEPLQLARKFEEVPVVLAEKRALAIPKILRWHPQTQCILLDDAMQHWALRADSYLMLSTYAQPFFRDFPLPAGNLREFRYNYKRADIIIISKCPEDIGVKERQQYLHWIRPYPHQKIFFSYFQYGDLYQFRQSQERISWKVLPNYAVFLVTGVANPKPLEQKLEQHCQVLKTVRYADHYNYKAEDWARIQKRFLRFKESMNTPAILVTTEKDAMRLELVTTDELELFLAPVEVEIAFGEAAALQRAIVEVLYKKKGYPTG